MTYSDVFAVMLKLKELVAILQHVSASEHAQTIPHDRKDIQNVLNTSRSQKRTFTERQADLTLRPRRFEHTTPASVWGDTH